MSREGRSPIWIAVLIVLILVASGLTLRWWMQRGPAEEASPAQVVGLPEAEAQTTGPVEATAPIERPPLPDLDESDPVLRGWVGRLSPHPQLARWLASEDLVRRFVAAVDNVAQGESPRGQLEMMMPETPFEAADGGGELRISPDSYARYNLAANVFASLDIGASVRLYHDLEPLFEEAYAEIGEPSRSFRQAFADAMDEVLAVEIPDGEMELEQHLLVYRFADPELEASSPAAKHLLRLGPENARQVQAKLRFLRSALDLEDKAASGGS